MPFVAGRSIMAARFVGDPEQRLEGGGVERKSRLAAMARLSRPDVVLGLLLLVGGLALIRASFGLPAGTPTDPLGPRGFPLLLGLGLAGCGIALAVASLRTFGKETPAGGATEVDAEIRAPYSWPRLGGAVAASAAYVVLLVPLGALFATIAYALALLLIQGPAGRREAAATAVGFPLVVYVLFDVLLGIPLPAGPLEPLLRRLGI